MPMNKAVIALGVIATILALLWLGYSMLASIIDRAKAERRNIENYKPKPVNKLPAILILIGIAGIIGGNSFTVIPTGYTGVKTTFGLIDEESCMPGFNVITPFVQKINLVNNKQQDLRISERISGETDTETVVYMDGVIVTYAIQPSASAWIYANVDNWVEHLVDSALVGDACRAAAKTCQNNNVTTRDNIEPKAKDVLQKNVDEKYGTGRIEIKKIVIINMSFDEAYEKAIAKKSDALQEQQEQEIRNQIEIDKAEAKAEYERRLAQGDADAERIRAEGKRDANKTISETMTDATLKQDAIDKWDGALPRAAGDNIDFGVLDIIGGSAGTSSNTKNTTGTGTSTANTTTATTPTVPLTP